MIGFLRAMLSITLAIAACAAASAFIRIMLQPIRKIEKSVRPAAQFLISDIFWLMLLVQLFLGVTSLLGKHFGSQQGVTVIIGGYLLLAAGALWWRGVGMLTALGIFHTGRRAVFLVVILPVAALGAIATTITVFGAVYSTVKEHPAYLILLLPIPLVCFAGRMLTVWVLSGSAPVPTVEEVTSVSTPDEDTSTVGCVATHHEAG